MPTKAKYASESNIFIANAAGMTRLSGKASP